MGPTGPERAARRKAGVSVSTRTAEERQREIVLTARREGSVDVNALADELGVAKETVRRDLRVLEDHGLLRRTHGGAYPVESAGFETTLAFRATSHVPEKRRIAAAAADLLGDAETVFVDEGFTPQLIAEALPTDRQLTVVTASLPVAGTLAGTEHASVLLLGGRVRSGTLATVDHWTTQMLAGFVIDLAFIGANGISREQGLTTPDPAVSEVKAQAVRASRRIVFAGVHTKFGAVSFCRFTDIGALETIVTSTLLPSAEAHRYSLMGPQVIRV
ncbi:DeoR family transcriptional regulator [Streptomyces zinciresistens K42]|uniref:Lactose phosphotransferase system repressor n=1 Tax=Streptomyces zinciresistens K42 TaxID=700597 RepID=G2GM81_9ACTN|nr:DeoR/GlpR family DNA-binding transcription regulator [Streptomyces zinciresistens]EGX55382.1 DeoR family transcriptional regulator [Streptomyces zinciresistens K42]